MTAELALSKAAWQPEKRNIRLEKTAIKISYEIGRQVKMSDLVNHLIDNYLEDAAKDMRQSLDVSK